MPKIVMISDTHTMHDQIKGIANDADVLLHAGDITYKGEYFELSRFNAWLDTLSIPDKVIIPGNHDLTLEANWEEAAKLITSAKVLNQQVANVSGLRVYGEPRQPWFFDWAFNVPIPKLKEVWDKAPTDVDVVLTHGPPLYVGDKNIRGEHCGCPHMRDWILENEPALVVCGHIHESAGIYTLGNTTVVNASVCNHRYEVVNPAVVIDL